MKSLLTPYNIVITILVAISVIIGCNHVAEQKAKERAAFNNCPYEGLECPNAQAAVATYTDSLIIYQGEVDELRDRNTFLEGQISLYHEKFGPIGGHISTVKGNEQ